MEVKIIVRNKEYIIGKEYEFSDILQEEKWHKGVLMGYCPHPNSSNSFVCGNQYYVHCREKLEELDYEILKSCPIEGTIHSIKRLSDGEVFTIGDKIRFGREGITKISLNNENSKIWLSVKGGGCCISIAEKLKTPLFTTEDGVGIRIDDVYYAIEYDFKIVEYYLCSTPNGYKQFSTKEEAEEYVLLNKPCLSLQDLLRARANAEYNKPFPFFKELEELAKSKL